MTQANVRVTAPVYPTELRERVETAIRNIFPEIEPHLEEIEGFTPVLAGEGSLDSLRHLHLRLRELRILDTARGVMKEGRRTENGTVFQISKQVAFVNKLNFPGMDEPLGSIEVEIESPDLDTIIDWLAPQTVEGKPVKEIEL